MLEKSQHYCNKCGRTMDDLQFYTSNNLEKYPNGGKLNQCKKCLTLHVDNWDPDTFKPILEEIDVPYIPDKWNEILSKYGKDPAKITGMTILGRYLATMKLKQWNKYRWADTEKLAADAERKKEEAMRAAGYEDSAIEANLSKDFTPERPEPAVPQAQSFFEDETPVDLTEEDKIYLELKWGKGYRPHEWVKMEQLYEDMMSSYDIQGAGHKDTLIMICKASLKANQLIDCGDVEGFQKMSKVYDSLMKSGKFTAAQNKGESGEYIDSIGELVAICEKEGFIPRYYIDKPNDKVDRVLEDLQGYTRSLVTDELNLGNMIESSFKEILADKQREESAEADDENDADSLEETLFSEESEQYLTDEDFVAMRKFEEEQEENDQKLLEMLVAGEEE